MKTTQNPIISLLVLLAFSCHLASCAGVQAPQPKVVLPAASYPHSATVQGVTVAAVVFDPRRSLYASPFDPQPARSGFDWFKAGVCPIRLIIENHASQVVLVDPTQFTATDAGGVTYQPYNAQEASDAVIASEAFAAYVRGAVAGAILGAALGAAAGAAVGAAVGGGHWAGRGAAIGAASGGTEGLVLGAGGNRAELELRVRGLLSMHQMQPKALPAEARHDGLVYFPAKDLRLLRVLLTSGGGEPIMVKIPVTVPRPPAVPAPEKESPAGEGQ